MAAGKSKKAGKKASADSEAGTANADAKAGGGMLGIALLAVGALASSFATVFFLTPATVPEAPVCETTESAARYPHYDRKRPCDALPQDESRNHQRQW
mgnify:CR=1 FL=1